MEIEIETHYLLFSTGGSENLKKDGGRRGTQKQNIFS
jgi:hypothetical protein